MGEAVKTAAADVALRLILIVVGLAGMVVLFLLADATEAWPAARRMAILTAPAAVAITGLVAGVQLREPFEERTHYGARRTGRDGAIDLGNPAPQTTAQAAAPDPRSAPTTRFGVDRRNTLVVLALATVALAIFVPLGLRALERPGLSETGLISVLIIGPCAFLFVRSLVRLVTASRAIVVDGNRITIGAALGFLPPIRLDRSELAAIVDAREVNGALHFVVDANTGYRIRADHLSDPEAVLPFFATWWPEVPAPKTERTPASFEELAPRPAAGTRLPPMTEAGGRGPDAASARSSHGTGSAPPPERLSSAATTLRRRSLLVALVLVVGIAGVAGAGWWYLAQRSANDRLATGGTVIEATVIDVDRSSRGPDSMVLAFEHQGVEYQRRVYSGFLSSFSRDLAGQEVGVLFDPDNADLVRFADRRNIHEATLPVLAGAAATALLGAIALSSARAKSTTLRTAHWSRRRIHASPRSGRTPATLVFEDDTRQTLLLRGVAGLRGRSLESTPSWLGVGHRDVVVLPDDPGDLTLTAPLPKGDRPTGLR